MDKHPNDFAAAPKPVSLLAVATAVPPHQIEQSAAAEAAHRIYARSFARYPKLADVFLNAGI
jgi:alkylresorcinol/alkylpyrone synthase